ncbi:hypothetical protein WR25_24452 [Diploscapter pachys]|uniref:Peptidase A1 domain-containing protein n=1 Tax=Diploscapter pachys TaxID=2018661 RepID=A0A2A2LJ29_9BILA|nr:hypothetical protein WR25_24452 [Diploscapter pachys]
MSTRFQMIAKGKHHEYLEYLEMKRLANKPKRRDWVPQNANDWGDFEYIGNITIIPDVRCKKICADKHRFDQTKSSTYKKDYEQWQIEYGSGEAAGFLGIDTVRFGDVGTTQLSVPKTQFGQAETIADVFTDDPAFDGILGLAFQSLSVLDDWEPVFINAIKQGLLDQPLFTVYLEHRGAPNNVPGGVYTYGAIDTVNCGELIAYQPLSSATYFQYTISNLSIADYVSKGKVDVISDTGTSFFGGPGYNIKKIAQATNSTWSKHDQLYYVDCATNVGPFNITINNIVYSVQPVNYIVDIGNNTCLLAFFEFDFGGFGPSWIFGDPFRVGFAPSLQDSKSNKPRPKMDQFVEDRTWAWETERHRLLAERKAANGKNLRSKWTNNI